MSAATKARTRIRRVVAVVMGVGLVLAGVGVTALSEQPAKAAQATSVLGGFDPSNIIDDAVMFNGGTMTAAQIQAFLNAKQPTCAAGATCLKSVTVNMPAMGANAMCRAIPGKANATAAQVIAAVGTACNVNPQVILVMLQKEQTLVTGRTPYWGESVSLIYRKATGLGCPDTAACDPAKYGLFNQLYGVAYWLVRYTTPPGTTGPGWTNFNWFPVGRPSGVLYNPSAACGAQTITIKNTATAALYYYTPYVPNAAAMAAGWGLGDSCSAYGNRNFYLYFTTWFGSTHSVHYVVTGAINTYWSAHKDTFGAPAGNAVQVSANGGGTFQQFANGTIYTSRSGTYGLTGTFQSKFNALGGPGGVLGWPRMNTILRKGGTVQPFQKGTVYASAAGTAAVLAPVYAKYGSTGYEFGPLGWPAADAVRVSANGGGIVQRFTGGTIYASPSGTYGLTGSFQSKFSALGGPAGALGWPRMATILRKGGTVQPFQKGTIYTSSAGTAAVLAPVYAKYGSTGYELGTLGWPTGDAVKSSTRGGAVWQSFQRGRVVVAGSKSTVLSGSILSIWLKRNAEKGTMGWPTADAETITAHGRRGTIQTFQTGIATVQGAIRTVTGATGSNYLFHHGPTGTLGWPTSPSMHATANGGGWWQRFQGGAVFWSAATGSHGLYNSPTLSLFYARGGTSGTLGWLQTSGHDRSGIGGAYAIFQNGRIYSSRVGTDAVLGAILQSYLKTGGTNGALGWPTSNAHSVRGATVQTFQHGKITWTKTTGAKVSRT